MSDEQKGGWSGQYDDPSQHDVRLVSTDMVCPYCDVGYNLHRNVAQGGDHDWPLCESGWTGDRCTFPLFHEGLHSND